MATINYGFTFIELMIVVAIIGILTAVGVPMYQGYMTSARTSQVQQVCSNVRADIESAIFFCNMDPDATLPIISTAKKTPCSWGNNGIALYMYQKHAAIAKTIPHPYGWGPTGVVGFNKSNMPFSGQRYGLLVNQYPVAIKFVADQKREYIEVTCNDVYTPPHLMTETNHGWTLR